MDQTLFRKVFIASVITAVISLGVFITGLAIEVEPAVLMPAMFIVFSLCALLSLLALRLQNTNWAKKVAKYSIIALPFTFFPAIWFSIDSPVLLTSSLVLIMISVLLILLYLIHIFLYKNATSLSGVIVILTLLVLGIFWKMQHWPMAGVIIACTSLMLCIGMFMFGVRCLFLSEGISYFKNISLILTIALSFTITGFSFKMQHWPGGGFFTIVGLTAQLLGTLYLLITLPSSGFIDWKPFHKKILAKILIPWTFFLFFLISRYMVPELNALIWNPVDRKTERKVQTSGFGMTDYMIESKNGIIAE